MTVLLNTAMVAERSDYLGAALYERSSERIGYANCYKDKHLKTRPGTLLAIAEMYVQGLSTRRVRKVVEELCGVRGSYRAGRATSLRLSSL